MVLQLPSQLPPLNQIKDIISHGVNLLTLGSYNDLTTILSSQSTPESSAVFVAWIVTAIKWALLITAIFMILRSICNRLGFTTIVAIILTGVSLLAIFTFYNTPMNDFTTIQERVSGFIHAFTTNSSMEYSPLIIQHAVLRIEDPISRVNTTLEESIIFFGNNTTVPVLQFRNGLPSLSTTSIQTGWFKWLITLVLVALSGFILSRFSKLLAIVTAFILLSVAFGFPPKTIACIVVIIACSALIYYLTKKLVILAMYPAAVLLLTLAYLLQPPQSILIIMLITALIISLLPPFYLVGYTIYAGGEIMGGREKFGLKTRPKRVIEEVHGQWDVNAITVFLTLLFTAVIALFGLSIQGLGTFIGLIVGLFRR